MKHLSLLQIPHRNEETLLLIKGVQLDRIGHGTFMHPQAGGTEEITQEVTSRRIPIGKSESLSTHFSYSQIHECLRNVLVVEFENNSFFHR